MPGAGFVLAVLIMVLTLGAGILVRLGYLGRDKPWYTRYRNPDEVFYLRNGTFAIIPAAVTVLLAAASVLLFRAGGRWADFGEALLLLSLLGIVFTIGVTVRPPSWLKPKWLQEEERRERRKG